MKRQQLDALRKGSEYKPPKKKQKNSNSQKNATRKRRKSNSKVTKSTTLTSPERDSSPGKNNQDDYPMITPGNA